jgi:hypothetical protein
VCKPLGPVEVRLLELQPGQVPHLDDRVLCPAEVLAGQSTVLAVQTGVRVVVVIHLTLL